MSRDTNLFDYQNSNFFRKFFCHVWDMLLSDLLLKLQWMIVLSDDEISSSNVSHIFADELSLY